MKSLPAHQIRVWDRFVRFFHWSLALSFTLAYISAEEVESLHVWLGYWIGTLVLLRLLWGFVGSRYARFYEFVKPASRVRQYLRSLLQASPEHYTGHNPAGGWMVLALLASLMLTTMLGMLFYGMQGHGLLASLATDKDTAHFFKEVHEFFANLTLLLVAGHLAGVVVASLLHGENLVRAMWTGYKRRE